MSLLKKIQYVNKSGIEARDELIKMPMVSVFIGGSPLLDKIIDHETKDYIYDGKKEGYAMASDEYEKKLLEQSDLFLQQKSEFQSICDEKEELLDKIMSEIENLDKKIKLTEQENRYLQELLLREHKIRIL